ncbi:unannotated protein [freshwater metagenome]|uniref:Unannotated protein n=1 Tax=freshwater metagenome TaxID=449393 RepID=A0A6J6Y632_9ZZZZ
MLHGLEATDRHTELLAVRDIGNSHRDHLFGQADELCGCRGSTAVKCSVRCSQSGIAGNDEFRVGFVPFDAEQTTCAIDGNLRSRANVFGRNGEELIAALRNQKVGNVHVVHKRLTIELDGCDNRTVSNAGQPLFGNGRGS